MVFAVAISFSSHTWSKRFFAQQESVPYNSFSHPRSYQQDSASEIDESSAAAIVKQRHGGRVLKIQKIKVNKGSAFRVKILQTSGHVKNVLVDAHTGKVINKIRR